MKHHGAEGLIGKYTENCSGTGLSLWFFTVHWQRKKVSSCDCMKRRWFSPRYHSCSSRKGTQLSRIQHMQYPLSVTGEPVFAYLRSAKPLKSQFGLSHPAVLPATTALCGESGSLLLSVNACSDLYMYYIPAKNGSQEWIYRICKIMYFSGNSGLRSPAADRPPGRSGMAAASVLHEFQMHRKAA